MSLKFPEQSLALPVRILFQPLLPAGLDMLRDGLHRPVGVSFSQGMNDIQVLFVYLRQGQSVMPGPPGGKDTDQISHFTEKFQRGGILGNAHEESVEADIRRFELPHLRVVQRPFPGSDQLIPHGFYFSRERPQPREVRPIRPAFGYF